MKERFTNIYDLWKNGKGISALYIIVVSVVIAGLLVVSGASAYEPRDYDKTQWEEKQNMALTWAMAWKTRDGKSRYEIMGNDMRSEFLAQQEYVNGDPANFVIRWSSPWVEDYEVVIEDEQAIITYWYADSTGSKYKGRERLTFGEEQGRTVVTDCKMELEMEEYLDISNWQVVNTGSYIISIPHEWNLDVLPDGSVRFIKNGAVIGSLTALNYYPSLPISQFAGNHAQILSTSELKGFKYPATKSLIRRTQPAAAHDKSYGDELHFYLIPENSKVTYDLCFDPAKVDEEAEKMAKLFVLPSEANKGYAKPVDISKFTSLSLGATMPELDYVSKTRAIFHGYFGLFVYDIERKQIHRSIDLKAIDSNYVQGSIYTEVTVSQDGKTVYLDNIGDGYDDYMYEYKVDTNELAWEKVKNITNKYVKRDILDKISLAQAGTMSATYGQIDENTYAYLWNDKITVSDFKLIIFNEIDQESHSYDVFAPLSTSY